MAAEALTSALGPGGPELLLRWLEGQDKNTSNEYAFDCNRSEFVTYFLCYLRSQTESILQTNSSAMQILQQQSTPEKLLSQKKQQTIDTGDSTNQNTLSVRHDKRRKSESPSRDKSQKKSGRRVKTKLFNESEKERKVDDNISLENMVISSTPMKNNAKSFPLASPITPLENTKNISKCSQSDFSRERCDTPRLPHSRHSGRLSNDKTINFGDYITNATKVSSKKKKSQKNVSNEPLVESNTSGSLDLSNSDMFPEIGTKKRIKPTNVSADSSSSFANFNSDFQPPTLIFQENSAFKQQKFQPKELSKSFTTERNILKQERHKLMEKFNILNTSSNTKAPLTPQIKILKQESVENVQTYIEGDANKITHKEKLDAIMEIYNVLLKNNLILSISAEMYLMISIVLSKQCADDCDNVENKLMNDNNVCDFLLKSLHNSSYVAIKTLWNQRQVLEIMLDKFSLKLLGENKRIRSFFPDLAKHLLNLYSLKCEGEIFTGKEDNGVIVLENRFTSDVVCFNSEMDSVDNFPSILSFQNFKKQRDMFYEILRWWSDSSNQSIGSARTLLRSRIKSLLSLAVTPSNHVHLATLLVAHLMSDCVSNSHESKLSKLQRRLTGPAPTPASLETNRLPRFLGREEFYRDFLMAAESESFRTHVRDVLAYELCTLDAGALQSCDDRQDGSSEFKQDYLLTTKRLRLLAKFLGLLVSVPHQNVSDERLQGAAKEKVVRNDVLRRQYSQPSIDLQSMLEAALAQNRLTITLPWLSLYLAMMDYACLRIKYFTKLLDTLFSIYSSISRCCHMKKGTAVFIKLCLGWLFELPHFPQEAFYEREDKIMATLKSDGLDAMDLLDENVLNEVCPYLKEFNVLLLTSQPTNDKEGSFRHITPVTMSLNSADRARNKERELQARLEQELLRSLATSTRRVLELVVERVTSATVKELGGSLLPAARQHCRREALAVVTAHRPGDTMPLLKKLEQMYSTRLNELRTNACERARTTIAARAKSALEALLPTGGATRPLEALARRSSVTRVNKWLADSWCSTGVLCKDIEAEMNHLVTLGESYLPAPVAPENGLRFRSVLPESQFRSVCLSAAEMIIHLKEVLCRLLEHSDADCDLATLLDSARLCCRTDNIFVTQTSRRAVLQLSVDMAVVLVSRNPVTLKALLSKFDALWDECCPNRPKYGSYEESEQDDVPFDPRHFAPDDERMPTPVSSDDEDTAKPVKISFDNTPISEKSKTPVEKSKIPFRDKPDSLAFVEEASISPEKVMSQSDSKESSVEDSALEKSNMADGSKNENTENEGDLLDLFNRILCPRNVVILSETRCTSGDVWLGMAGFLVFLLKNNYLSEDSLTEQCLAVYRQDWPQSVLEALSTCMRAVSSQRPTAGSKFTLFLDFLTEFCGDMDLTGLP